MDAVDVPYPEAGIEGFQLRMFVSYGDVGDASVEAPDGSTCGLVWETGEPPFFLPSRWRLTQRDDATATSDPVERVRLLAAKESSSRSSRVRMAGGRSCYRSSSG
jgi:hypothetical protein